MAFTAVLAGATIVSGLAAALTLAFVLAFAAMLIILGFMGSRQHGGRLHTRNYSGYRTN